MSGFKFFHPFKYYFIAIGSAFLGGYSKKKNAFDLKIEIKHRHPPQKILKRLDANGYLAFLP